MAGNRPLVTDNVDKGTSISRVMEPYKAMMERMSSQQESDVWKDVRRKLT